MEERIEEILSFWFGPPADGEDRPTGIELWFQHSVRIDRMVEKRFARLVEKARAGALDGWAKTPRGRLALILLLDQFSRHVHRDRPEAFESDEKALQLCLDGVDDDIDKQLGFPERAFFYMPAMHAEDVDVQLTSVEIYGELVESAPPDHRELCTTFLRHAERHREVMERFERFPQRNSILGRTSTPEEATFLQQAGEL